MGKTSIEWTDHSWPIVNGCRRISPGCGRARGHGGCYAERLSATRLAHMPKYQGLAVITPQGPRWTGEARLWEPHLRDPLKLRKPSRIFVADMGDLFYEGVSDEDIDRVFAVMSLAPRHTFQVLTKRPKRMATYLASRARSVKFWEKAAREIGYTFQFETLEGRTLGLCPFPLPNVWLGTSVEDLPRLERIDALRAIPWGVRFLSLEPLLEDLGTINLDGIDWMIVGGESGPGASEMLPAWVRSLRDQSVAARVPFFFKQWGGVHKKKSGRELDGRTWSEFPATSAPPVLEGALQPSPGSSTAGNAKGES